jgi:hypothetical protein
MTETLKFALPCLALQKNQNTYTHTQHKRTILPTVNAFDKKMQPTTAKKKKTLHTHTQTQNDKRTILPTVNAFDKFPESVDLHLDAGLGEGVVVLNAVQQARRAPKTVRLHDAPRLLIQLQEITVFQLHVWVHKVKNKTHDITFAALFIYVGWDWAEIVVCVPKAKTTSMTLCT